MNNTNVDQTHPKLTLREGQISAALARGLQAKEIASEMGLTTGTVRTYLKTIYSKLDVHSGLELVARLGPRPTKEISAGSFLDIANQILSAGDQRTLREALAAGLQSATNAGRVEYWNLTIAGGRDLAAAPCADASGMAPGERFLRHLIEFDWAIEGPPDQPGCHNSMGVTLLNTVGLRHFVYLAAPTPKHFDQADLKATRVLAILASRQFYAAAR